MTPNAITICLIHFNQFFSLNPWREIPTMICILPLRCQLNVTKLIWPDKWLKNKSPANI